MKKRISFIIHMPPPVHGASMMGKYIHDSRIINKAFNCRYFNLTLAKNLQDIGKGGVRKLIDLAKQIKALYKQIKVEKPDLCYVTPNAKGGAFYKDFLIVMMLKAMKQEVVIHYHNKGVSTRQDKIIDNILYRLFFKNLKVIILADVLYNDIKKYVKKEDVYICPNGIPEQTNIPTKLTHEGFNILFLSNMMEEKGVWDLLDACKILKERGVSFHCNFVGKWSDITEDAFNHKVQKLGLRNCITGHGAKYGNEKDEFFQNADVFVFPTFYNNECFPLVLLEAMEQGIACISCNEGGISSIIDDGETGYIIDKHLSGILADKLEYLIKNPEVCKNMGLKGKEKFNKEFTLTVFETRIRNILTDIINNQ
ncbi:MAG: glycosyl transferase [Bacteroides sp. 43_108]|nr:MAG: glycosyl transferase [Bacteroides sp. 43_108]